MKNIYQFAATLFFALIFINANAQNNLGINTPTPDASAALDVTSTTQGMLVPRMSTAQRNAISSPARGLMVYDNTLNNFYFFNGSAWTLVGAAGITPYPNIELSTTNTVQQAISSLFGTPNFTTLNLSSGNNTNASLTGGNTWTGTTFTIGTTGAGWYQITAHYIGVLSGTNNVTNVGANIVLDKNGAFGTSPALGTYPLATSTYDLQSSSSFLKNHSSIQMVTYLAAGDYLNLRAQSWSTSTASYSSTDGSTNIQIIRIK